MEKRISKIVVVDSNDAFCQGLNHLLILFSCHGYLLFLFDTSIPYPMPEHNREIQTVTVLYTRTALFARAACVFFLKFP